jgi:hypothetical protein
MIELDGKLFMGRRLGIKRANEVCVGHHGEVVLSHAYVHICNRLQQSTPQAAVGLAAGGLMQASIRLYRYSKAIPSQSRKSEPPALSIRELQTVDPAA